MEEDFETKARLVNAVAYLHMYSHMTLEEQNDTGTRGELM